MTVRNSQYTDRGTSHLTRQPASGGLRMFGLVLTIVLVLLAIILPPDTMRGWSIPVSLWIIGVAYAVSQFRQRVMLFAFLMTFAFFLLSKPILMVYFGYEGLGWSADVQAHLVLTLSLGLLGLLLGHLFMARVLLRRDARRSDETVPQREWRLLFSARLERLSFVTFLATLPFTIAHLMTSIETADKFGYTGLYLGGGNSLASISAYGNVANTVALALFLATIPSARKTWLIITITLVPRAALLVTGDRGDFGTFLLMLFVYIVFRSRDEATQLMSRRLLWIVSLAAVAIIIPVFITVGLVRGVGAGHKTVVDFLYGQGASLNVLEYGKVYADALPDGHYMLLFMDQGIFRLLFGGVGGLSGNSVAYALSGTSFSHSLSYTVLGNLYLTGRGVGTSYLAEAYADWGYIGVALVGLAYGLLIAWIGRFPLHRVIGNALRLTIISAVLFAPRGSATAFITTLLSPVTVVVMLGVWILARVVTTSLKQEQRRSDKAQRSQ